MLHKFKVAKYLMYLTPTYLSERGPFDIRSTLRRFYGLSRNTTRPFHVFFFNPSSENYEISRVKTLESNDPPSRYNVISKFEKNHDPDL